MSKGYRGPSGHEVPLLTLHNMLRPDDCHVSMGCQVLKGCQGPNGCQVPSLTSRDMLCPDAYHLSMGR